LLIIPAATARLISKSPKQMVLGSVFIATAAVVLGLYLSLDWDLPAGPAIVVAAACLFFILRLVSGVKNSNIAVS
jgi:zinc transport system permease protein